MGIYDRDYVRDKGGSNMYGPRGGGGRMAGGMGIQWRSLSITMWLIIINCVVFFGDAMLYSSKVRIPTSMGTTWVQPRDPDATYVVSKDVIQTDLPGGYDGHPVFDAGTRELVGYERFLVMPPMQSLGHFSTGKGFFALEVWRLITFQFLHGSVSHLLFNMIALFFFGPLVERYFRSPRRYLAFYLLCGMAGAGMYLILNILGEGFGVRLPGALQGDWFTTLVGASAGVFGILMASAFVAGDAMMYVMGIIPMKIRTGAYLMTAFAAYNLIVGGHNAGGDAAHIGGAIAGFYLVRRQGLLNDFFDFFGPRIPVGRSKSLSAGKGKAKPKRGAKTKAGRKPNSDEKELDRILAKVKDDGLGSLSEKEKKFLREQSE